MFWDYAVNDYILKKCLLIYFICKSEFDIEISWICLYLYFEHVLDFREMYFPRKCYVNSQTYKCLLSIYNTHHFPLLKCFRIQERLWGIFWHRKSVLWLQLLVILCEHLTYMSRSSSVLLFGFGI